MPFAIDHAAVLVKQGIKPFIFPLIKAAVSTHAFILIPDIVQVPCTIRLVIRKLPRSHS